MPSSILAGFPRGWCSSRVSLAGARSSLNILAGFPRGCPSLAGFPRGCLARLGNQYASRCEQHDWPFACVHASVLATRTCRCKF
eukprot:11448606-Heterocapsa_arctica.AAC.1